MAPKKSRKTMPLEATATIQNFLQWAEGLPDTNALYEGLLRELQADRL